MRVNFFLFHPTKATANIEQYRGIITVQYAHGNHTNESNVLFYDISHSTNIIKQPRAIICYFSSTTITKRTSHSFHTQWFPYPQKTTHRSRENPNTSHTSKPRTQVNNRIFFNNIIHHIKNFPQLKITLRNEFKLKQSPPQFLRLPAQSIPIKSDSLNRPADSNDRTGPVKETSRGGGGW